MKIERNQLREGEGELRITWLIYHSAKHSSLVTETKYLVPLAREGEREARIHGCGKFYFSDI